MTSVAKGLKKARAKGHYVWVECEQRTIRGFVLGYSDSFLLVHRFLDFFENGYIVVRRDRVDSIVRKNRSLKFFEKMMGWEGVLDEVGIDFDLPLDSVASLLRAMSTRDEMVLIIVPGERDDEDADFTVGKILEVTESSVRVRPLTSWGEWWDEVVLDTTKIERIEIDTPYLRALNKYAPPRSDGPAGGSSGSAEGGAPSMCATATSPRPN